MTLDSEALCTNTCLYDKTWQENWKCYLETLVVHSSRLFSSRSVSSWRLPWFADWWMSDTGVSVGLTPAVFFGGYRIRPCFSRFSSRNCFHLPSRSSTFSCFSSGCKATHYILFITLRGNHSMLTNNFMVISKNFYFEFQKKTTVFPRFFSGFFFSIADSMCEQKTNLFFLKGNSITFQIYAIHR